MGYYIQTEVATEKAVQLVRQGAEVVSRPSSLSLIPEDKALICVVENGLFDAAALIYSDQELEAFSYADGRRRTWLLMAKDTAHLRSGYKEQS